MCQTYKTQTSKMKALKKSNLRNSNKPRTHLKRLDSHKIYENADVNTVVNTPNFCFILRSWVSKNRVGINVSILCNVQKLKTWGITVFVPQVLRLKVWATSHFEGVWIGLIGLLWGWEGGLTYTSLINSILGSFNESNISVIPQEFVCFLCLLFAYANADTMQSCKNFAHYLM